MDSEQLIKAEDFCLHHQVELSFIYSLGQSGLLSVITIEETAFIPADSIASVEKLARLHYQLDINVEGIESIVHLLEKISDMQQQIMDLQNRLSE